MSDRQPPLETSRPREQARKSAPPLDAGVPGAAAPAFKGAPGARQATFQAPPRGVPPGGGDPGEKRIRSQPIRPPVPATAAPVAGQQAGWRWTWMLVAVAAIAWLTALGLLGSAGSDARISSPRLTLALAWAAAAFLTFLPLELRLGLPGITLQGMIGWTLLGYMLAFVPAPTGWLLELPDLPVYLLMFVALFYALASAALPLTYLLGLRLYSRRLHQHDLRRSRRQAREIGLLAVALMTLAALRVLMPLTALLLIAVFALVETLLLSQVAPEA